MTLDSRGNQESNFPRCDVSPRTLTHSRKTYLQTWCLQMTAAEAEWRLSLRWQTSFESLRRTASRRRTSYLLLFACGRRQPVGIHRYKFSPAFGLLSFPIIPEVTPKEPVWRWHVPPHPAHHPPKPCGKSEGISPDKWNSLWGGCIARWLTCHINRTSMALMTW